MAALGYELGSVISNTPDGVLRRATSHSGERLTVLYIKSSKLATATPSSTLKRELRLHNFIGSHPHILGVEEVVRTRKGVYIVRAFCKRDTLQQVLLSSKKRLSERKARGHFRQLLSGVSHLHSKGIAHLNLKPESVLLDSNTGDVKISAFGFATAVKPEELLHRSHGTAEYCAPCVVLSNQGYDGKKADIWSLGALLYCWCAGFTPFQGDTAMEIFKSSGSGVFAWPQHFSQPLRNLLAKLLVVEPDARLSLDEMANHPWLSMTSTTPTTSMNSTPTTSSASTVSRRNTSPTLNFPYEPRLSTYRPPANSGADCSVVVDHKSLTIITDSLYDTKEFGSPESSHSSGVSVSTCTDTSERDRSVSDSCYCRSQIDISDVSSCFSEWEG